MYYGCTLDMLNVCVQCFSLCGVKHTPGLRADYCSLIHQGLRAVHFASQIILQWLFHFLFLNIS